MPVLEALGFAVPGEKVPQGAMKEKAGEVLGAIAPDLLQYLEVFDHTGIESRHFVRPIDWYLESHGWKDRAEAYAEAGLALVEAAARDALDRAALPPSAIDAIVLVSTTGVATPSLDARVVNRLGLRSDIQRVPVFGLGCAGGVAGLNLAADLARSDSRRVLVVAVETCSLAFNLADMSVKQFVAATLFSDGAAAAIVRSDDVEGRALGRLRRGASHQWPDTEWVMGWDVVDEGLDVVFSRKIPDIVEADLAPAVASYLKREEAAPTRFPFHPGGTKILEAYEKALHLPRDALDESRRVLSRYGNMSSPTVLFTLAETLRRPLAPRETALAAALGPGFSAELALLEG